MANGHPPAAAVAFVASTKDDWDHGTAFGYAVFASGRLAGATGLVARIGPDVPWRLRP